MCRHPRNSAAPAAIGPGGCIQTGSFTIEQMRVISGSIDYNNLVERHLTSDRVSSSAATTAAWRAVSIGSANALGRGDTSRSPDARSRPALMLQYRTSPECNCAHEYCTRSATFTAAAVPQRGIYLLQIACNCVPRPVTRRRSVARIRSSAKKSRHPRSDATLRVAIHAHSHMNHVQ
jgi:hypothetical protein